MNEKEALQHFRDTGALLEGHFILTSGLRSPIYLQCAKVLMHPERAAVLCEALVTRIKAKLGEDAIDFVISPAMGGVVVGYEMGRQLGCAAIFAERVEGNFELRRGFEIPEGARILMAEDIVTTGLSSRECIDCIQNLGGVVAAASCLIDRSGGKVDLGVPLFALVDMEVPAYEVDQLPEELSAIPAVKPGSRGLQ